MSKGGVPKLPVPQANVTTLGLEGDVQKDKRYHGGPERALCLFSIQLIHALQLEGHAIQPGSTGENLTLSMTHYDQLQPGDILYIGNEVVLQVTSYAAPCKTIKASFIDEAFTRISEKLHPGQSRLYARVLHTGEIRQGDAVRQGSHL
jgi:MOSC domain-containing protein YiiM